MIFVVLTSSQGLSRLLFTQSHLNKCGEKDECAGDGETQHEMQKSV